MKKTAEKVRPNSIRSNLCDEASAAMQEQNCWQAKLTCEIPISFISLQAKTAENFSAVFLWKINIIKRNPFLAELPQQGNYLPPMVGCVINEGK